MVIGLDISTSCIGICYMTDSGRLIKLEHLVLESKENNDQFKIIEKSLLFKEKLKEELNDMEGISKNIHHVFVESPQGGSQNPTTQSMLFAMNTLCCYHIENLFSFKPKMITVREARQIFLPEFLHINKQGKKVWSYTKLKKADPKFQIKEYVRKRVDEKENKIEWIYKKRDQSIHKYSYDQSDAYVVAFSGLRKYGVLTK